MSALRAAMAGKRADGMFGSGNSAHGGSGHGSGHGSNGSLGGGSSSSSSSSGGLPGLQGEKISFGTSSAAGEVMEAADGLRIPYWCLRFISMLSLVGLHALFVPITTTLLSPFQCVGSQPWTLAAGKYKCFDSGHVGFLAASVVLLPLWIGWSLLIALCLINRVPDLTGKRNILCASHGRVAAFHCIIKLFLAALFIFSTEINVWAYCICVLIASLAYCFSVWRYLPYFHQYLNQAQLAIGCVLTAAAASHLLAAGVGDPSHPGGATALLVLCLPAVYVGFSLANIRFRSFSRTSELATPFAVELRMRFILAEAITALGHGHDAAAAFSRSSQAESLYDASHRESAGVHGIIISAHSSNSNSNGGGTSSRRRASEDGGEVTEAFSLMRSRNTDAAVTQALSAIDHLYKEASGVFASSAVLQLFRAHFLGTFRHNQHLERLYLSLAEDRADQMSVDVRFFVYQRRMQIRGLELALSTLTMNVDRRMQFERLIDLSREQVTGVRGTVLTFWTELSNRRPDLQRVQTVGTAINVCNAAIHVTFKELLDLAPQSASVMRSYADFLLELANDPARAMELLTDAEQIEEEQSKAHASHADVDITFGGLAAEFDLTAESLAWITVSSEAGRVGVITDANSSLLKMYGYNRREMLGREMSFIVPEPIASIHPRILERYQSTGQERVVNQSRILFGLHRAGHIFPVKINIRPNEQIFTAVFEEIVSSLSFVFFLGGDHGWKVMAACKTTMSSLRFDPIQMKAGSVSMKSFMKDPTKSVGSLAGADDAMLLELGNMRISSRLQIAPIPFLSTPVYIMRYRILGFISGSRSPAGGAKGTAAAAAAAGSFPAKGANVPLRVDSGIIEVDDDTSENGDGSDVSSDADSEAASLQPGVEREQRGDRDRTAHPPPNIRTPQLKSPTVRSASFKWSENALDSPVVYLRDRTSSFAISGSPAPLPAPPSGHPSRSGSGGDISLCPVMGGGGSRRNTPPSSSNAAPPANQIPGQVNVAAAGSSGEAEAALFPPTTTKNNHSSSVSKKPSSNAITGSSSPSSSMTHTASALRMDRPGLLRDSSYRVSFGNDDQVQQQPLKVIPEPSLRTTPRRKSSAVHASSPLTESLHGSSSARKEADPSQPSARGSVVASPEMALAVASAAIGAAAPPPTPIVENKRKGSVFNPRMSGKAGSVRTKGSLASENTASTDMLREIVAAKANKLETSLASLKRAIAAVLFVIAALNVISLIVTATFFNDLKHNLDLVGMNGDRVLYLNKAVGHIQALSLAAEGKLVIPEGTAWTQNKVTSWADLLEGLHRELYLGVDGVLEEELDLYTNSRVHIQDLIPGTYLDRVTYRTTERDIGLANAGIEVVSKLRLANALGASNMTPDQSPVWFVLVNGISDLRHAMNQSLMNADARSNGHDEILVLANFAVMIVAECMLLLIIITVMVPAINSAMAAKQRIFNTFLDVPLSVTRALREKVQMKMDAIARSETENDQGFDTENVMVDETDNGREHPGGVAAGGGGSAINYGGPMSSSNSVDGGGGVIGNPSSVYKSYQGNGNNSGLTGTDSLNSMAGVEEEEEQHGCTSSLSCCRRRRRSGTSSLILPLTGGGGGVGLIEQKRRRKRRYHNTSSARFALLLKLVFPLLCYAAYFAGLYVWRLGVSDSTHSVKSEVLWTKMTQAFTGEITATLRNAYGYCDPAFVGAAVNQSEKAELNLQYLQNGLMFGAPELFLRPGIRLSDDIYKFAMVNGCYENGGSFYAYDTCTTTFYDGLFGKGFMPGFREFSSLVRQAILTKKTELLLDPTLANCDPSQGLNTEIMQTIDQMRWRYIAGGFAEFSRIRLRDAAAVIVSFLASSIAVTAVTILALQLFYSFLYKPMITFMDNEIKNVRQLLLLFPDEISKQVPAIVAAGRELISDSSSVTSAPGA